MDLDEDDDDSSRLGSRRGHRPIAMGADSQSVLGRGDEDAFTLNDDQQFSKGFDQGMRAILVGLDANGLADLGFSMGFDQGMRAIGNNLPGLTDSFPTLAHALRTVVSHWDDIIAHFDECDRAEDPE